MGPLTPLPIVMRRPDYTFEEHRVHGFPGADHCGWSRGFPRREVTPLEKIDPSKGAAKYNEYLLLSMHPGKDDDYLKKSMVDAGKGLRLNQCPMRSWPSI